MNKNDDDFLVKKAEEKAKNSKTNKVEDIQLAELLAGIRTLLKSDSKNKGSKG